jgi:hypothetical protein
MAGSDGPCEAETDLPRHDATSRSLLDRIIAQHVTILMTSLIFSSSFGFCKSLMMSLILSSSYGFWTSLLKRFIEEQLKIQGDGGLLNFFNFSIYSGRRLMGSWIIGSIG